MASEEWIKRELDDIKASYKSLEQKLWGLIAAVFLLVVGYLFGQLQDVGAPAPAAPAASAFIAVIMRLFGG